MEASLEVQDPYRLDAELAPPGRSNVMFPEWNDDHMRALAVDMQAEIDLLDNEISRTRILLPNPLDHHDQKTERYISPLNRIPAEILSEIFVICGEGKPTALPPNYSSRPQYPSRPRYPWTLGQVSSHWREVLWRTPDIWRNLEVGNIRSTNDNTIEVVLDISSRLNGGLSLSTREKIHLENPMGTFILGSIDRFQHLAFTPSHLLQSAFFNLPSGSLDTLESIEMELETALSVITPHQTTALHTARNLTKATFNLNDESQPFPAEILLLPWGQLTEMSFTGLTLSSTGAHFILNQCSRLISCTLAIDNTNRSSVSYPPSKEVILPTLRSLTLVAENTIRLNWVELLRPLELSSLKTLDLQSADNLEEETLASLLVRSRCALETLKWEMLCWTETEPDQFHPVLGQLASIRTLTIPYHYLSPAVFEATSRNQGLSEIKHLVCRVEPEGLQAFVDLVERCIQESSGRIESAALTCNILNRENFGAAFNRFAALEPGWRATGRVISLRKIRRVRIRGASYR